MSNVANKSTCSDPAEPETINVSPIKRLVKIYVQQLKLINDLILMTVVPFCNTSHLCMGHSEVAWLDLALAS